MLNVTGMRLALFLCVLVSVMRDGIAGGDVESWHSRSLVISYYNKPKEFLTVTERTTRRGKEVEVCGDYCDLFVLPVRGDEAVLWDAILLTKVFLSDASDDQAFAERNLVYAQAVLQRNRTEACARVPEQRKRTWCVLDALANKTGLERASVTYDEGNRCEAFASFKEPSRVLKSRCTRVKQ